MFSQMPIQDLCEVFCSNQGRFLSSKRKTFLSTNISIWIKRGGGGGGGGCSTNLLNSLCIHNNVGSYDRHEWIKSDLNFFGIFKKSIITRL